MQTGRSYLRVILIAAAMTVGPSIGFSQPNPGEIDAASVSARADTVLADIANREKQAKDDEAKKCLAAKKAQVQKLKGQVPASPDRASLLAELNNVAGELDACTGGDEAKGGGDKKGDSKTDGTNVQLTVEEGTPDGEGSNPSVVIPPGHSASGPGAIGEGTGSSDVSTPGTDPTTDPGATAVPPPISPIS